MGMSVADGNEIVHSLISNLILMITNSYSPGDHTFGEFIKHLRMC